ncbi:MAG: response regulator transcription factor [Desulfobacterales bacterium]|jgi:FixJ family two-component response regulator|nr:response regulator transcription factor [Desulfobacteraceae bacterium]MDH4010949.1 response regulator transcription factor [Desulfobacterales bacterium]
MVEDNPIVFIVDDDDSVRKSLARLITSVGLKVETFSSANAFLKRDAYDGPACLVLDIRMPGLSGLELQTELAKAERTLSIVFITSHGNITMSVQAIKAGAVDFLEKPFEEQDLLDAVHLAIQKDRATKEKLAELREIQERVESLTPREREVFALVVTGMLNKQIAFEMGIGEKTIKVHRARVMQKMQAESFADLVRLAEKLGIGSASS